MKPAVKRALALILVALLVNGFAAPVWAYADPDGSPPSEEITTTPAVPGEDPSEPSDGVPGTTPTTPTVPDDALGDSTSPAPPAMENVVMDGMTPLEAMIVPVEFESPPWAPAGAIGNMPANTTVELTLVPGGGDYAYDTWQGAFTLPANVPTINSVFFPGGQFRVWMNYTLSSGGAQPGETVQFVYGYPPESIWFGADFGGWPTYGSASFYLDGYGTWKESGNSDPIHDVPLNPDGTPSSVPTPVPDEGYHVGQWYAYPIAGLEPEMQQSLTTLASPAVPPYEFGTSGAVPIDDPATYALNLEQYSSVAFMVTFEKDAPPPSEETTTPPAETTVTVYPATTNPETSGVGVGLLVGALVSMGGVMLLARKRREKEF